MQYHQIMNTEKKKFAAVLVVGGSLRIRLGLAELLKNNREEAMIMSPDNLSEGTEYLFIS